MKKIFYTAALFGAAWTASIMLSCDKDKQLPPDNTIERVLPPIEEDGGSGEENPNEPKDYVHAVAIMPAEDFDMGGSGVDLATGKVHRGPGAHNYMHAIDLLYLDYGNPTKGNIALPESGELSVNTYGEDIQYGWSHKNSGVLYCLDDVQPRDVEWFNGAKSAARISAVADSMINVLSANVGNQKQRFRNVQKDQIFIFKSTTRNIASVIYVNQQIPTTTGSQCRLIIKSDATQLQEVAPVTGGLLNANGNYYADEIEGTFNIATDGAYSEVFFDLKAKRAYSRSELDAMNNGAGDYSNINLIFVRRNSNGRNGLFVPKSNFLNTNLAHSELLGYLNGRSDVNGTWKMRRYDADAAYGTPALLAFEDVRLSNDALFSYYTSYTTDWTSFWSHFSASNPPIGLVARISNRATNISVTNLKKDQFHFGTFKLLEMNPTAGKVRIGVKFYNSLD